MPRFSAERKEAALDALRRGSLRAAAARSAGVSKQTFYTAMKTKSGRLTAFGKAVLDAETEALGEVENALWENAVSGNVPSMIFWLCNRAPDEWKQQMHRKLEYSGSVKSEIVSIDVKAILSDDQSRAALENLARRVEALPEADG